MRLGLGQCATDLPRGAGQRDEEPVEIDLDRIVDEDGHAGCAPIMRDTRVLNAVHSARRASRRSMPASVNAYVRRRLRPMYSSEERTQPAASNRCSAG